MGVGLQPHACQWHQCTVHNSTCMDGQAMEQASDGWRRQPWESIVDGRGSGSSTVHGSSLGALVGWIVAAWVEEDVAGEWAVKA